LCSGYLYIANVMPSDDRHGYKYVCIANNPVLGAHVQGQDQQVEPIEDAGMVDMEIEYSIDVGNTRQIGPLLVHWKTFFCRS